MSWLFQSFILLMKFITGPSENLKNSLILTLLHLCPNCCPRVSKCFPLLKKKLVCFYIIAVFYNKIKNHLWNPRSNRKSISPEQTKSMNMCSQKGLFYTSYSMREGRGGRKNKQKIILSLLLLASTNSPHFPRRQILSINISVSSEVLEFQGVRRSSSSCVQCLRGAVLPRGSVQGDDVGHAAAAAGDDAGLGPARGANVRAALVVAGGGDDAARRAAC